MKIKQVMNKIKLMKTYITSHDPKFNAELCLLTSHR